MHIYLFIWAFLVPLAARIPEKNMELQNACLSSSIPANLLTSIRSIPSSFPWNDSNFREIYKNKSIPLSYQEALA